MPNEKLNNHNAKSEYDLLSPPANGRINIRQANPVDLKIAYKIGNAEIPGGISAIPLVAAVIEHNSDNAYVFLHQGSIVGFYAMLMLCPCGLEQLLRGELDCAKPDLNYLTKTGEIPAAIYKWAMVAPGLAAEGILHMSKLLRTPKFKNANFYSRPNTSAGVRINLNRGFKPVKRNTSGLYRYVRLANRISKFEDAA